MMFIPNKSFHAFRVKDPSAYKSFATKEIAPGVNLVLGINKGKSEAQSYHFDTDKFTFDEAKKWTKGNKLKTLEEVPAEKPKENEADVPKENASWDGDKSTTDLLEWATDANQNISKAKVAKYFLKVEGDGTKKGDYSYPVGVVVDGKATYCPMDLEAAFGDAKGSHTGEVHEDLAKKAAKLMKSKFSDKLTDGMKEVLGMNETKQDGGPGSGPHPGEKPSSIIDENTIEKIVQTIKPEVTDDGGLVVRSLDSGTRYFITEKSGNFSVINKDDTEREKGTLKSGFKSKQDAIDHATNLIKDDFRTFAHNNPTAFSKHNAAINTKPKLDDQPIVPGPEVTPLNSGDLDTPLPVSGEIPTIVNFDMESTKTSLLVHHTEDGKISKQKAMKWFLDVDGGDGQNPDNYRLPLAKIVDNKVESDASEIGKSIQYDPVALDEAWKHASGDFSGIANRLLQKKVVFIKQREKMPLNESQQEFTQRHMSVPDFVSENEEEPGNLQVIEDIKLNGAPAGSKVLFEDENSIEVPVIPMREGVFSGTDGIPTLKQYEHFGPDAHWLEGQPILKGHTGPTELVTYKHDRIGKLLNVQARPDHKDVVAVAHYFKDKLTPDDLVRIKSGTPYDGSIAYTTHTSMVDGEHNGSKYNAIEDGGYHFYHFAEVGEGACSVEKGCGFMLNDAKQNAAQKFNANYWTAPVKSHLTILNQQLAEVKKQFADTKDPAVKMQVDQLAKQIAQWTKQLAKLNPQQNAVGETNLGSFIPEEKVMDSTKQDAKKGTVKDEAGNECMFFEMKNKKCPVDKEEADAKENGGPGSGRRPGDGTKKEQPKPPKFDKKFSQMSPDEVKSALDKSEKYHTDLHQYLKENPSELMDLDSIKLSDLDKIVNEKPKKNSQFSHKGNSMTEIEETLPEAPEAYLAAPDEIVQKMNAQASEIESLRAETVKLNSAMGEAKTALDEAKLAVKQLVAKQNAAEKAVTDAKAAKDFAAFSMKLNKANQTEELAKQHYEAFKLNGWSYVDENPGIFKLEVPAMKAMGVPAADAATRKQLEQVRAEKNKILAAPNKRLPAKA